MKSKILEIMEIVGVLAAQEGRNDKKMMVVTLDALKSKADEAIGCLRGDLFDDSRVVLKPSAMSQEVWDKYVAYRNRIKKPLSELAIKRFDTEVRKAGITHDAAAIMVIENGWQGFLAEYVKSKAQKHRGFSSKAYGSSGSL